MSWPLQKIVIHTHLNDYHHEAMSLPWHRELDMMQSMVVNMRLDPPELSGDNLVPRLVCSTKVDIMRPMLLPMKDYHQPMVLYRKSKNTSISKKNLAKRWHIGQEAARTLLAITQSGIRFIDGPLEHRLKTSQVHNMRFPTSDLKIYSDTLFAQKKSVYGFFCAQVITDRKCFGWVYPLRSKGYAHQALMQFIQVGILKELLMDGSLE
jgi:hypothetical protein